MIVNALLKISFIRKKIIHSIKQYYFNELDISLPIENDYWARLYHNDSYDSFSEIFIQNEYQQFNPQIEVNTLIDLGAHHGFFSLWLQSKQPKIKIKSLLIEPSSRCEKALLNFIHKEKITPYNTYFKKCIGNPQNKFTKFYDRPHMASSQIKYDDDEDFIHIPILQIQDITNWNAPPYDLLKCDIEGAEWELLNHYKEILKETKFLIIEWHKGQVEYGEFRNKLIELDFNILQSTYSNSSQLRSNSTDLILAKNNIF